MYSVAFILAHLINIVIKMPKMSWIEMVCAFMDNFRWFLACIMNEKITSNGGYLCFKA